MDSSYIHVLQQKTKEANKTILANLKGSTKKKTMSATSDATRVRTGMRRISHTDTAKRDTRYYAGTLQRVQEYSYAQHDLGTGLLHTNTLWVRGGRAPKMRVEWVGAILAPQNFRECMMPPTPTRDRPVAPLGESYVFFFFSRKEVIFAI